jgi:hypothetical protein
MQSRAGPASIPLIQMRPSNERELAIARTVDKLAIEDRLDPTAMDGIVAALGFPVIHPSDRRYLEQYVEWRMANPIVKAS